MEATSVGLGNMLDVVGEVSWSESVLAPDSLIVVDGEPL